MIIAGVIYNNYLCTTFCGLKYICQRCCSNSRNSARSDRGRQEHGVRPEKAWEFEWAHPAACRQRNPITLDDELLAIMDYIRKIGCALTVRYVYWALQLQIQVWIRQAIRCRPAGIDKVGCKPICMKMEHTFRPFTSLMALHSKGKSPWVKIKIDMLKLNWEGVAGRSCSICSTAANVRRYYQCRKTITK